MIHDTDIICIASIDWDFVWQSHQEIMSVLASNGNRVLFIENTGVRAPTFKDLPRIQKRFLNWRRGFRGIRKEAQNLYIYSPIVLPFPYSRIANRINRAIMLSVINRWMKVLEFHDPIVWSFLPTALTLDIVGEIAPSIFIYYCVDDLASSSRGARKIKKVEEKVIATADLVFATSHKLFERCRSLNKNTYRFPCGVRINNYDNVRRQMIDMPHDMRGIKRPIVGYIGGIHKWLDFNLLRKIADERKDISLVLIGPKQADLSAVDKVDNIHILGEKSQMNLPAYVKYFDAGIIPYLKMPYTENVYPTKINEYLAMGKPVISTKIPEVVEFDRECGRNFIYFVEDEKDFNNAIRQISSEKGEDMASRRIAVANANSWSGKIEAMCGLIEERLLYIRNQAGENWLKGLKRFYVKSRRRTLKFLAFFIVLYMFLFYSPFLWMIAEPLKISQPPQKADAIVVFGGGVGESGSPGESTIERAGFSVELYKNGFSKYILYSSGYTYKYNDAESMKRFAMSMGIPERNIILEQKSGSTYENVKYTRVILKDKGFTRIILISSPYNMRRASLVFANIAKDIKVVYVPVPDPQFYYREGPVKFRQIRGIMHEYLGIIYYVLKGYIKI